MPPLSLDTIFSMFFLFYLCNAIVIVAALRAVAPSLFHIIFKRATTHIHTVNSEQRIGGEMEILLKLALFAIAAIMSEPIRIHSNAIGCAIHLMRPIAHCSGSFLFFFYSQLGKI